MPDENDVVHPQGEWNPPGGDSEWDQFFGAEEGVQHDSADLASSKEPTTAEPEAVETQPETTEQKEPQASPATTQKKDEFFLKTRTGTVYKRQEDLVNGIEEKDRVIADLRKKVTALAGIDPLKEDFQTQPESYLNNPSRYAKDLTEYARKEQYDKYLQTQMKAVDEYISVRYGHILPKVGKLGQRDAVDEVSSEIPAFKDFYGSEDYEKALERHPRIKEAVQTAEGNPALQADYLPDLYKTIWDISAAIRTSDPGNRSAQATPNPTPRMPTQARSIPAPPVQGGQGVRPSLYSGKTLEERQAGREALKKELEAKGVLDVTF